MGRVFIYVCVALAFILSELIHLLWGLRLSSMVSEFLIVADSALVMSLKTVVSLLEGFEGHGSIHL